MKVVLLNYAGCYIEVSDVPMNIANKLEDGEISDIEALYRMGYTKVDDSHWMFTDTDFPVFWKNEVVPYTSL